MGTSVLWRAGASWQDGPKTAVKQVIGVDEVNRRLAAFRESWAVLVATSGGDLENVTVDLNCLFEDLAELLSLPEVEALEWLDSLNR